MFVRFLVSTICQSRILWVQKKKSKLKKALGTLEMAVKRFSLVAMCIAESINYFKMYFFIGDMGHT